MSWKLKRKRITKNGSVLTKVGKIHGRTDRRKMLERTYLVRWLVGVGGRQVLGFVGPERPTAIRSHLRVVEKIFDRLYGGGRRTLKFRQREI